MSQALATKTVDGVEVPSPGTWVIDPAHSTVGFQARHLMVSKVRGRFTDFSGTLHIDEVPERAWAEVEIKAASIDTAEQKRDDHLRSPDFLDAERYPVLRYRSTGLTRTGETSFRLDGDLTIRDATRAVPLDVTYEGTVADPWGNAKAVFAATTEIDREQFGITWNQALETGGVLVGRKVRIEIEVQATRQ